MTAIDAHPISRRRASLTHMTLPTLDSHASPAILDFM
jgi:hypothetical protein